MAKQKITVIVDKIQLIKSISRQCAGQQRAQVIPNKKAYKRHEKHRSNYRDGDG